jgi:PadR family transcriptional regulator, regulatory protein PadR
MDLIKGTLDMLILRTLTDGQMHGYGVSQWIRERTSGALHVQDAALYQALRRLEEKRLVEAEWGVSENNRRARYYRLTPAGAKALARETTEWCRYADAVFQVLDPVREV